MCPPGHALQGGLRRSRRACRESRREVYHPRPMARAGRLTASGFFFLFLGGGGGGGGGGGLGVGLGMYDTPYDRFGMLTSQMGAPTQVVVDTGVHHKGDPAQAIDYMHDTTADADHASRSRSNAHAWPGQALKLLHWAAGP